MSYPTIDVVATGKKINLIRKSRGIKVVDIADYMGFSNTNSIYKWLRGETMPSLDNIYALSILLDVTINDIIVACA